MDGREVQDRAIAQSARASSIEGGLSGISVLSSRDDGVEGVSGIAVATGDCFSVEPGIEESLASGVGRVVVVMVQLG